MLTRFPFHSLFLSVYPICYLYARNAMFILPAQTLRPLLVSLGLTVVFLLGFRLVLRDWQRAGFLSSLIVVLFYSYGHVSSLIGSWAADRGISFKELYLGAAWLTVFLALSLLIVQRGKSQSATGLFNLASAALLVIPLVTIVIILAGKDQPSARELQALANLRGDPQALPQAGAEPAGETPDIYYIVLDGYQRADVLLEAYGYDNSGFIQALKDRGFYVADQSRSNYLSTNYSLSTSLNLAYFSDFPAGILRNARYNLQTNFASEFLRERGYRVVVFDSGTGNTNNQYSDEFVAPAGAAAAQAPGINPFEILLLKTTMVRLMVGQSDEAAGPGASEDAFRVTVNQELAVRRGRIRHLFMHLPDYATQQGDFFLFAHVYLPHIPFLYGPNEAELDYHGDPNVNWYVVPPDNYAEYYGYQLDYLNRTVLETIDQIQQSSGKPLVIILQADHGDDFMLDWDHPSSQGVAVRSSILNAIYFSDRSYEDLYSSMTPVNTFRLVFNHWFGARYPLLQDKTFFHEHPVTTTYGSRLVFQDACETYNVCSPLNTNLSSSRE
jgi:hypothetical protein